MTQQDWQSAEDILFERSQEVIRQFASEHTNEVFSLFAYSVDCEFTGAALNFDTRENALKKARRQESSRIKHLNSLFALEHRWEHARYEIAHHTNRMIDFNLRSSWKYNLVAFVELPVWENFFNSDEETSELEGRIIVSLWRVVDRLVAAGVFDVIHQGEPFRIAFGFHDDETIVMRILNWPKS